MTALLRLQLQVLLRARVTWFFAGIAVLLAIVLPPEPHFGERGVVVLLGWFFGAYVLLPTLAFESQLERLRWSLPVRGRTVLSAYLLFSAALASVLAYVSALLSVSETAVVLPVAASHALLGVVMAAWMPVVTRLRARGSIPLWALAVTAWFFLLGVPLSLGAIFTFSGRPDLGLPIVGAVVALSLVVGGWTFLRAGAAPAAQGRSGLLARVAGRFEHTRPRPPSVAILRATFRPLPTLFWGAFGLVGVFPRVPAPLWWVFGFAATQQFAIGACVVWKWLAPTPIDRRRTFRLLFLPIVGYLALGTAGRIAGQELGPDRTRFFAALGDDVRGVGRGRPVLSFGDLLRADGRRYLPADPSHMAVVIGAHLRSTYGLEVDAARIERSLRTDWPDERTAGDDLDFMRQEATFRGMARLQDELAPEIVAAERTRTAIVGVAAFLGWLLFVRLSLIGFRPSHGAARAAAIAVVGVVLVLATERGGPVGRAVADSCDGWLCAAQNASGAAGAALVAGAAAAAWWIWRDARRAFARLDGNDLPRADVAKWWGATT